MTTAVFILGKMEALCLAELRSVVGEQVELIAPGIAALKGADPDKLESWQQTLGGTVKIGTVCQQLPAGVDQATIFYHLVEYFVALNQEKVYFAVGELGRDHLEPLDERELKVRLEENGIKARFAEHSRYGVGAALLQHRRGLIELLVINTSESVLIVRSQTVQDIDEWSWRDRAKPYADRKKGMLPPKLARMMVNLAHPFPGAVLYDPFCGTGTILLEAATLGGMTLLGSDLDVKATLGTGENLDWWVRETGKQADYKLVTADVSQVKLAQLGGNKVNLLVSEPFLGKQTPRDEQLPGIFRGLEKLYWGAFRHWCELLVPEAKLVVIFPRVTTRRGQVYHLDSLLDKLHGLGYNKESQGLMYAREHASVSREICVFEWQGKTS